MLSIFFWFSLLFGELIRKGSKPPKVVVFDLDTGKTIPEKTQAPVRCWWTRCGLLVKTNGTWCWKPPKMCWEWRKWYASSQKGKANMALGASSNFKHWIRKVNQDPNKWLVLKRKFFKDLSQLRHWGPSWKWCMSTTVLECYIGKPSVISNWLGEEACAWMLMGRRPPTHFWKPYGSGYERIM